jgi:hypothetical protein
LALAQGKTGAKAAAAPPAAATAAAATAAAATAAAASAAAVSAATAAAAAAIGAVQVVPTSATGTTVAAGARCGVWDPLDASVSPVLEWALRSDPALARWVAAARRGLAPAPFWPSWHALVSLVTATRHGVAAPVILTDDAGALLPPLPRAAAAALAALLPRAAHGTALLRPRPAPTPLAPAPALLATVPAAAAVIAPAAPAAPGQRPAAASSLSTAGTLVAGSGSAVAPGTPASVGTAPAASGGMTATPGRGPGAAALASALAVAAASAAAHASLAAAQTAGAAAAAAALLRELPAGALGVLLVDDVTPCSRAGAGNAAVDCGAPAGGGALCAVERRAGSDARAARYGAHGSDELRWPRFAPVAHAGSAAVALMPAASFRAEAVVGVRRAGLGRAPPKADV